MPKPKKETGLVKVKEQNNEVSTFIQQAIAQNLPVETMEKLFALRERVKAEQAKEEFINAMGKFQEVCPVIEKTKEVKNKDGITIRYKFAPIDSIVKQIQKPLAQNGLAYSWKVLNETGFITAICTITHFMGHSETSEFKVPIDTEGYMTAPQKYASALTFAKRYSLLNALGIATGEEDIDATDQGKDKNAKSDKSKIMFLLKSLGKDTSTKESIEKEVKTLSGLKLIEENYGEIVARLEVLVKEKQEYDQDNQV